MRRSGLLLAFENEFQVRPQRQPRRPQCIERRCDRHDRRFVVRCRARIDAPFRIDLPACRQRDHAAVLIERAVANHRLPGRRGPLLRIQRLPVIVRIEEQVRVAPGVSISPKTTGGTPGAPSIASSLRVSRKACKPAAAFLRIGSRSRRQVRQCQQVHELREDSPLVCFAPVTRRRCRRILLSLC